MKTIRNLLPLLLLPLLLSWMLNPCQKLQQQLLCQGSFVGRESLAALHEGASESIKLIFMGDVMQHLPQVHSAYNAATGRHEYKPCFRYIAPLWQSADFVVANFETTIDDHSFSGYPQFVSPRSLPEDLYDMGVRVLVTANNHACDNGRRGILKTIEVLDSIGVQHTGTFADSAQRALLTPIFLRKQRFNIALLNYTYGTNGLPIPQGTFVNLIDTLQMKRDIEKSKNSGATHVILFIHWGNEYQRSPSSAQRELARWCYQNGVDVIIGSHPHVIQPIEVIREGGVIRHITVYSLGNFISNQRQAHTDGGLSVELTLTRSPDSICEMASNPNPKTDYQIRPLSSWVWMPRERGQPKYVVVPEYVADEVLKNSGAETRRSYKAFIAGNDEILGDSLEKITR